MGLMDKFKNLFTEEVEEEVKPIKKEVRHIEIPSPKRETKVEEPKETVSDSTVINKEEKFVFPVYFDDKDFDDLEKPKKEEKIKKEPPKVEAYQGAKLQTKVERKFEASPIISPVYGVLDKNYKKEDIATRKEQPTDYARKPKAVTVDDIRNKAFGTLEDDLEDTLFGNKSILFRDEEEPMKIEEDTGIDIFEELDLQESQEEMQVFDDEELPEEPEMESIEEKLQEEDIEDDIEIAPVDDDMDEDTILLAKQLEEQKKKLEQINEYINENTTEEVELSEEPKKRRTEEETEIEEEQDLTESELLSLVDAMYEKRDDE